ncbi:hypothetical protein CIB95_14315 [Lottiidibacillus patelloidae]|uniref:Uncharacterized protein n=1 Tax=Lottiidibacillus patelloidae TaxID=2670334 RepID=A0A263BQN0_9BACI|nr:hypothetical protein [Lottiidibacillus patelloidae]OZM56013.1 hypothetical protein CIB95_14315 [Lottiidibacillus patelloidae]
MIIKSAKNLQTKIIPIVIIAGLLSLFFSVSSLMVQKEKSLTSLQNAIETGDVTVLQQLLTSEDSKLEMTKENVERFLTHLDTLPKDKDSLLEAVSQGTNHPLLSISTQKKWLFFEAYEFAVQPIYIDFDIEDEYVKEIEIVGVGKLKVDGESVIRSVPLMPGNYKLISKHETDYQGEFLKSTSVNAIPLLAKENNVMPLTISTDYIFIYTNSVDSSLIVNGQATDITISESPQKVHGLPSDGRIMIAIEKEFPWGTITSEEVSVDRRNVQIYLNLENDKVKKDVSEVANTFVRSWLKSVETNDISNIENTSFIVHNQLQERLEEIRNEAIGTLNSVYFYEIYIFVMHPVQVNMYPFPKQKEYYEAGVGIKETYENGIENIIELRFYYDMAQNKWLLYEYFDYNG